MGLIYIYCISLTDNALSAQIKFIFRNSSDFPSALIFQCTEDKGNKTKGWLQNNVTEKLE